MQTQRSTTLSGSHVCSRFVSQLRIHKRGEVRYTMRKTTQPQITRKGKLHKQNIGNNGYEMSSQGQQNIGAFVLRTNIVTRRYCYQTTARKSQETRRTLCDSKINKGMKTRPKYLHVSDRADGKHRFRRNPVFLICLHACVVLYLSVNALLQFCSCSVPPLYCAVPINISAFTACDIAAV